MEKFCLIFPLGWVQEGSKSPRGTPRISRQWKAEDRAEQYTLQNQESWDRAWGMYKQLPDDSEGTRDQLLYFPVYTKEGDHWRCWELMFDLLLAEKMEQHLVLTGASARSTWRERTFYPSNVQLKRNILPLILTCRYIQFRVRKCALREVWSWSWTLEDILEVKC